MKITRIRRFDSSCDLLCGWLKIVDTNLLTEPLSDELLAVVPWQHVSGEFDRHLHHSTAVRLGLDH